MNRPVIGTAILSRAAQVLLVARFTDVTRFTTLYTRHRYFLLNSRTLPTFPIQFSPQVRRFSVVSVRGDLLGQDSLCSVIESNNLSEREISGDLAAREMSVIRWKFRGTAASARFRCFVSANSREIAGISGREILNYFQPCYLSDENFISRSRQMELKAFEQFFVELERSFFCRYFQSSFSLQEQFSRKINRLNKKKIVYSRETSN